MYNSIFSFKGTNSSCTGAPGAPLGAASSTSQTTLLTQSHIQGERCPTCNQVIKAPLGLITTAPPSHMNASSPPQHHMSTSSNASRHSSTSAHVPIPIMNQPGQPLTASSSLSSSSSSISSTNRMSAGLSQPIANVQLGPTTTTINTSINTTNNDVFKKF